VENSCEALPANNTIVNCGRGLRLFDLGRWGPPYRLNPGGGTGEPNNPYLIYTAEHLNAMGIEPYEWDKHFKLMADIDLAGYAYDSAVIASDTDGDGYSFPGTSFTGVFDGNGHAVLHLTIKGRSYLGLIGQLESGAEVKDLGVVDVNITGSYYAIGGLAGETTDLIVMCYSTGMVSGDANHKYVPRSRMGLRGRDGKRRRRYLVDYRRTGLSGTVVGTLRLTIVPAPLTLLRAGLFTFLQPISHKSLFSADSNRIRGRQ